MHLNHSTDHAIKIILHLSKSPTAISSRMLSVQLGVSRRYLIKIASRLKDVGIIKVKKGQEGGYYLSRQLRRISVYDIVQLMEGPVQLPTQTDQKGKNDVLETIYAFFQDNWENAMKSLTFDKLAFSTRKDIIMLIFDFIFTEKAKLLI